MFKIVLAAGLILFIIAIIILSVLIGIKKINYKTFWILLPIISLIIILSCDITNALIANQVSLLSNWDSKIISEETTYSDQINIYLKEENGKKIIEKVGNTYYFYSDENTEFLNSVYNKYNSVFLQVSDKTGYIIKTETKKYGYEFAGDFWFINDNDSSVIEKIKTKSNSSDKHIGNYNKSYSAIKTELIFFVPKDTLIKTKDKNKVDVYKTIDEFNEENKCEISIIRTPASEDAGIGIKVK